MEESNVDEFRDQYEKEAEKFITQSFRENKGKPEWDSRNENRHDRWLSSTRFVRSNVPPGLFEYSDRRSKGLEPPPGNHTWPGWSKERVDGNRAACQMGITLPPPEERWREVDWSKSSSLTHDDKIDPNPPLEADESYLRSDELGKLNSSGGEAQSFPKARVNIPPETIKDNGLKIPSERRFEDQARKWEQDLDNPEKDTEIPTGFAQHPGRPWTEDDEEQLLDMIESGEYTFARIGQQIQRTEDDCHRKYQYLACLEVNEPRVGKWSAEQDAMLVRFVEEYKIDDWDRIAFHCGTTVAEARRYWESRKPVVLNQTFKRNFRPGSDLAVTNSTTTNGALISALDEMFDSNENARISSRSSTAAGSLRDAGSQDDQSQSPVPAVPRTQTSTPLLAAALSGAKRPSRGALALVPGEITRGQKRGLAADEEVNEGEAIVQQPKHKTSRTDTVGNDSASKSTQSASVQILRRSSRANKGEKKHDSNFLWYNPYETKSLSKIAVSKDPPLQPAAKKVHSRSLQASAAAKKYPGTKKATVNGAPATSKAERGEKRAHMDIEEHDEAEPSRRKVRRTGYPKVDLKKRRNISAAPQAMADTRPLRRSSRLHKQELATAASTTTGSGRGHGLQANTEAGGREEARVMKIRNSNLQTVPGDKAVYQARENPQDDQDKNGQSLTDRQTAGGGRKRGREVEMKIEEEPQRKRRASQMGETRGSAEGLPGPQEAVQRSTAIEQIARPIL